ncbi:MAG: hypothetical protein AVDCRST_MAG59-5391, partial [uncultured Thermomicrobiales bacterium]
GNSPPRRGDGHRRFPASTPQTGRADSRHARHVRLRGPPRRSTPARVRGCPVRSATAPPRSRRWRGRPDRCRPFAEQCLGL